MLLNLTYNLATNYNSSDCKYLIIDLLAKYWIVFSCLIHPTHNLIVLAIWQTEEFLINKFLFQIYESLDKSALNLMFFYLITSQSCYFSQGNSNSLNTIQISSGFVGINEMNMFLIGLLLVLATYSSNIYWLINITKSFFKLNIPREK